MYLLYQFFFIGRGDHTEVVDIEYNPNIVSYSQLLALFWQNHEYGLTTKIKRQVNITSLILIFTFVNYIKVLYLYYCF